MQKGDEVLYLGTIYSGGGWLDVTGNLNARGGEASVTVFWPFQDNLDVELYKFLESEKAESDRIAKEITAKQEAEKILLRDREVAITENTFYTEKTGCHAIGINAELQILNNGVWQPLTQSKGWDIVANCPSSNPVQPWAIAEIEQISQLRWRFWVVGQFDVFGSEFKSQLSAKAAAELKAKQEAEAKAAAELKAKQEADAKTATEKAALGKAQSELAAANAALADAQKVNREQAARISSLEMQLKAVSESVTALQTQLSQLNSKLVAALAGQNAVNVKLKKVCSVKPKPKGC
jgi:myosin heavy subunit